MVYIVEAGGVRTWQGRYVTRPRVDGLAVPGSALLGGSEERPRSSMRRCRRSRRPSSCCSRPSYSSASPPSPPVGRSGVPHSRSRQSVIMP